MKRIGIIPILFFVLTACSPVRTSFHPWQPWQLSDLRLLELPNITNTTSDLIAIYTRQNGDDFQFRFDFFDLQPDFDFNVYILLDTTPTGNQSFFKDAPPLISSAISDKSWDWMLALPLHENLQAFLSDNLSSEPRLIPRIQRDPFLDTITISFNHNILPTPQDLIFQVFITTIDGEKILDKSLPISNMLAYPIPAAPLILVFSDAFPAVTPAQALRRWDGAHTGPTGERHGLKHILSNVEIFGIPVVLLDLKNPLSLSALDFIGALPQVQKLVSYNLLILPETVFAQPGDLSLQTSQKIDSAFNLPGSIFVYSKDKQLQADFNFQFVNLPDHSHIVHQAGKTLIPLPDLDQNNTPIQAGNEGLSPDVRRQLLITALSTDPTDLVVLGGSLPHSTWGDSDMSKASMAYIAAHPWIQTLNANQIQTFFSKPIRNKYEPHLLALSHNPIFTSQGNLTNLNSDELQALILKDLQLSPQNTILNSAWQMFFTLTNPSSNPLFTQIQNQYINQVESLLTASRWVESSATTSDCSQDIDLDTLNECVLSNTHFFAIIEPDGGRLSFLFSRDGDQVHQLIGPLSQFAIGLSDPSLWHPEIGPASDPSEIPGAFSDSDAPFMIYSISECKDGILIMNRSDDQVKKIFHLDEIGLSIAYNSKSTVNLSIPLAIDQQERFQPGWANRYYSQKSTDSIIWGLEGNTSVEIRSTETISAIDFTESSFLMKGTENPNLDFPSGHFLPFPLALIEISGIGQFSVDIMVPK